MTGERVQIACRRAGGHWVLTLLRHVGTTANASNDAAPPTQFSGAITALSDTSISLHDGNRDLTCAIDSTSPSVATLKVGMHVNVSCAGGTLASWAPIASGRAYQGKISRDRRRVGQRPLRGRHRHLHRRHRLAEPRRLRGRRLRPDGLQHPRGPARAAPASDGGTSSGASGATGATGATGTAERRSDDQGHDHRAHRRLGHGAQQRARRPDVHDRPRLTEHRRLPRRRSGRAWAARRACW